MHRVQVKLLFQITGCMDMHLMYIDSFHLEDDKKE
jgi:hypothetical protein